MNIEQHDEGITTPLGNVKVKAIVFDGQERLIPEFEESRRMATEKDLPPIEVYKMLEKGLR